MKLSLDKGTGSYLIRAYGPGRITVNETEYTRDLIVLPETLIPDWESALVTELTENHFEALEEHEPEIILLGTGREQRLPAARLIARFARRGIGLEAMDTAAACRTFNVLMSEDRRVAAALMMIEDD